MPSTANCYAALQASGPLVPHKVPRRDVGPNDVKIKILAAGICHSDIHQVREEWGSAMFPMVPGHEIGGVISEVGEGVTNFSVGDQVGVGCFVDSCRSCRNCKISEQQYCTGGGFCATYNSKFKYKHCREEVGSPTYGGYSDHIVVDAGYVLNMPANLDLKAATPLLCAGITVYSPMRYYRLRAGEKFGVAGLGGLGHVAVKIGAAFGADTWAISGSESKREEATTKLGASGFLLTKDLDQMNEAAGTFDFILDTISADHDIETYLKLLKPNGRFILVGLPTAKLSISPFSFVVGRRTIAGSLIGGIAETQEMLDFCGSKGITCDIEVIKADQINEAYDRTVAADVKYRFVIDVENTITDEAS